MQKARILFGLILRLVSAPPSAGNRFDPRTFTRPKLSMPEMFRMPPNPVTPDHQGGLPNRLPSGTGLEDLSGLPPGKMKNCASTYVYMRDALSGSYFTDFDYKEIEDWDLTPGAFLNLYLH